MRAGPMVILCVCLAAMTALGGPGRPLQTWNYGTTTNGVARHIWRLDGVGGLLVDVSDDGGRIVRIYSADATGELTNLVKSCAGWDNRLWKAHPTSQGDSRSLTLTFAEKSEAGVVLTGRLVYRLLPTNLLTIDGEYRASGAAEVPVYLPIEWNLSEEPMTYPLGDPERLSKAALLRDAASGRELEIWTKGGVPIDGSVRTVAIQADDVKRVHVEYRLKAK